MMINVKERKLIVFFAKNEEESVTEFQDFGKVIPPNSSYNLKNYEKEKISVAKFMI